MNAEGLVRPGGRALGRRGPALVSADAPPSATSAANPRAHALSQHALILMLLVVFVLSLFVAATQGAYAVALRDLWAVWVEGSTDARATAAVQVFANIRAPRLILAVAAGAGLAVAGALMQGLFRNPLADPGLIGVSSGAALAAGLTIVMGAVWFPDLPRRLGSWTLVVTAFAGGLAVTAFIYSLSRAQGASRLALMLLAGIAVNALAGAGLGFLSFLATDEQLRSLQFWLLGSLGGARWSAVALVAGVSVLVLICAWPLARALNALALGEAQASLLGVDVEALKRRAIVLTAFSVGAITATTGMIGFIGLIAPHAVRLLAGPNHRIVLPASALLGASLILLADALARTAWQPAELPLGVLTAFLGVPMFLALLQQFKGQL